MQHASSLPHTARHAPSRAIVSARPGRSAADAPVLDPRLSWAQPVPLFTFVLPDHLKGLDSPNRNRTQRNGTTLDDQAMVEAFLTTHASASGRFRWYRNEVERFLLYMLFERDKALSAADKGDCREYMRFLVRPQGILCGTRVRRTNPCWTPFGTEPATAYARNRAEVALSAAFDFFVHDGYLRSNPWRAAAPDGTVDASGSNGNPAPVDRDVWEVVVECMQQRGSRTATGIHRAALPALLMLGDCRMLRSQAAVATLGELRRGPGDNWQLSIPLAGGHCRIADVGARTVAALRDHWSDLLDITHGAGGMERRPLLRLSQLTIALDSQRRARQEEVAANEIYHVVESGLRAVYHLLEQRLGDRTPPVHGLIQALEVQAATA